jgi:hypothetical protein
LKEPLQNYRVKRKSDFGALLSRSILLIDILDHRFRNILSIVGVHQVTVSGGAEDVFIIVFITELLYVAIDTFPDVGGIFFR